MAERTKKQIASGQRRTLLAMSKKLLDMAAQWGDLDNVNMGFLEEQALALEGVAAALFTEDD